MAGWTQTYDGSAVVKWHEQAKLVEFQNAVNERRLISGPGILFDPVVAVGDNVQAAIWWFDIQNFVTGHWPNYLYVPSGSSAGYYDNKDHADLREYASLAELFSVAGLGTSNFRRYTTHPDDGGSDLGGKMVAGDIIGPWIMEDIQKCLNVMLWTREQYVWAKNTLTVTINDGLQADNVFDVWATAKSLCDAEFDGGGGELGTDPPTEVSYYSYGYMTARKQAGLRARIAFGYVAGTPTGSNKDIDFYVHTIAPTAPAAGTQTKVFDANGFAVINGKWSLWDTVSASTSAAEYTTTELSDNTKATWCAEPTANAPKTRGWTDNSATQYAVLRWNVAGGFVYY